MQYRRLGKTGLKVSEIGLGAAQIGNRKLSEKQVESALNQALDLGINFIDTAAMYGKSEELIGKYISHRRDEFILATKCGDYERQIDGAWQIVRDYTPNGILETIDESRKKLNMDVIDIVQFHGVPDNPDQAQAAYEALFEAKQKGWTKFVGLSHDGPAAVSAAGAWPLDTLEFTYNILHQEADGTLFPLLNERQMGAIIKQPIAHVIWQMSDKPDASYMAKLWQRAQTFPLRELAGDMPILEFVLRFTLAHPSVHTAIIGAANPEHIKANCRISDGRPLPDTGVQKAKEIFTRYEVNSKDDAAKRGR